MIEPLVLLGLGALALACLAYGLSRLAARYREARYGTLLGVDAPQRPEGTLRAPSWRLAGRPDELRRIPDGRIVPVEWKSRPTPRRGPYPSHRVQVLAYLALVEETTGRPPPFGVLRYGDGGEFRIPWDAAGRAELRDLRRALDRPYDGRHSAAPAKCAGCRWRAICDVRAA